MKLEDKVRIPIEATLRGEKSNQDLVTALEREMEILRGHHQKAPKSDLGERWREALEIYFEALEYAIELAQENRLHEQEELANVYAICAEADELMDELEQPPSGGLSMA